LQTSCDVVQLRLHCGLAGAVGEAATHEFRQPIAAESQLSVQVLAIDVCGSNCTGGGGGMF
jgi:hypothetical protein